MNPSTIQHLRRTLAWTLVSTGLLTVDPDSAIGFDIFTELQNGVAVGNTGYASLVVGGATGLYRVKSRSS